MYAEAGPAELTWLMVGVATDEQGGGAGSTVLLLLLMGGSGNLATPPLRQLCRAKVGGDVLLSWGEPDFRPG